MAPLTEPLRTVALPFMEDLYIALQQHVQLAVLEAREAVIVERMSRPDAVGLVSGVGGGLPPVKLKHELTEMALVEAPDRLRKFGVTVMDGPFSESKELIGGFAVLDLPSVNVAIQECTRYAEILGGTLEIDVRLVEQGDAAG